MWTYNLSKAATLRIISICLSLFHFRTTHKSNSVVYKKKLHNNFFFFLVPKNFSFFYYIEIGWFIKLSVKSVLANSFILQKGLICLSSVEIYINFLTIVLYFRSFGLFRYLPNFIFHLF